MDPAGRTSEVYVLEGSEYRLAESFAGNDEAVSPLLPDLQIPLANLWA